METVTKVAPTAQQLEDLEFAAKICKHTKSNTIVLAKVANYWDQEQAKHLV